jgi:hypothetical protein
VFSQFTAMLDLVALGNSSSLFSSSTPTTTFPLLSMVGVVFFSFWRKRLSERTSRLADTMAA